MNENKKNYNNGLIDGIVYNDEEEGKLSKNTDTFPSGTL